jgi:hypothetical protein
MLLAWPFRQILPLQFGWSHFWFRGHRTAADAARWEWQWFATGMEPVQAGSGRAGQARARPLH